MHEKSGENVLRKQGTKPKTLGSASRPTVPPGCLDPTAFWRFLKVLHVSQLPLPFPWQQKIKDIFYAGKENNCRVRLGTDSRQRGN